jgi:hypothetical protein
VREIACKVLCFPEREGEIVLGIVRQFADAHKVQAVR